MKREERKWGGFCWGNKIFGNWVEERGNYMSLDQREGGGVRIPGFSCRGEGCVERRKFNNKLRRPKSNRRKNKKKNIILLPI